MVSVKQFSILSVFLVAFAESALGAPLASNHLALRSEVDSDVALQLAIRDLLEDVDLDDRDLEDQLEELMARAPPVPQPKRKNAILVPPKPSGGGSQGQSITGQPITEEPKPIKPASKFRRAPPAPRPRPQPKRKNAILVLPKPSGGGSQGQSITGQPITEEPKPIKPASKFRRAPPAPQPRPQPKRKNAIVVPPKPSGGGSQGQSITGRPITKEPKPIKPASKFRRAPPVPQPRPQPKRKNAIVVPPPKPSGGGGSITGRPLTKEPRPIKPASKL